ncbi:MAG: hypothetical protein V1702_00620, partial [Candidatus Woesearchaeota archaeon]
MNYLLFAIDLAAIAGFSSAFYSSLKVTRVTNLFSPSAAIRSIALFNGVIWCVLLAFHSYSGSVLVDQAAASLLAFMGGLFTALIVSR